MKTPEDREYVILPLDALTPTQGLRHTEEEVKALAESYSELGVLRPLLVGPGDSHPIFDGHGGLAAARRAGLTTVPCLVAPDLDTPRKRLLVKLQANDKRLRKPLTASEIDDITRQLGPELERAARERQEASRAKPGERIGRRRIGCAESAQPTPRRNPTAHEKLAGMVGVGKENLRRIEIMGDAANQNAAVFGGLLELADSQGVAAAWSEFGRLKSHQARVEAAGGLDLPPAPNIRHSGGLAAARIAADVEAEIEIARLGKAAQALRQRVESLHAKAAGGIAVEKLAPIRQAAEGVVRALGGEVVWGDEEPAAAAEPLADVAGVEAVAADAAAR